MITSKSLHQSNVVFLFDDKNFVQPANEMFFSLFGGKAAEGTRFVEDPIIKLKTLMLPNVKLKIACEGSRLLVHDLSQEEPRTSKLGQQAAEISQKLANGQTPFAFGFNFDVYFRFNNVVPIKEIFEKFFGAETLNKADLRDFGFQFTLEKSQNNSEIWFLKVTAPLEIAIHLNNHFSGKTPAPDKLQTMFENCYNDMDSIIKEFRS